MKPVYMPQRLALASSGFIAGAAARLRITARIARPAALVLFAVVGLGLPAWSTENGAGVWPVGAEGFATAAGVPEARKSMFYDYTCSVAANRINDANGQDASPGFRPCICADWI